MSDMEMPNTHDLELSVFGGPITETSTGVALEQFNGLMGQLEVARQLRQPEEIERIEQELGSLTAAHAGIRVLIAENHLDKN